MNYESYFRFALALVLVLGLIGLTAWGARRLGLVHPIAPRGGRERRLGIIETTVVDTKRRLILVRRDDVEHLVLLGPGGDTVIENHIPPVSKLAKVGKAS